MAQTTSHTDTHDGTVDEVLQSSTKEKRLTLGVLGALILCHSVWRLMSTPLFSVVNQVLFFILFTLH